MKPYIILFLLIPNLGLAQSTTVIEGKITGKDNHEALVNALITISNSTSRYQVLSNLDGYFKITLKEKGSYKIEAMYLGYKNVTKELLINDSEPLTVSIELEPMFTELTEVEVVGDVPIVIKEDTIQFSSSNYKTHEDATAEDLVTKIPGVETDDNGGITAEGESVKKILVDGKEFFGDDPKNALTNLPAEMVDYVQIIDQKSDQSEFTGFDDGERSKTINFVTNKDAKYSYFGKAEVGVGTDQRYSAGGNINIFKGEQRLSFTGLSNNVNQQGFMSDNLSEGPKRGRRGRRGNGNGPTNNLTAQSNGINTSHSLGTNYIDSWGDKWDVNGSYTYKIVDNETDETSTTDYFVSESTNQVVDEILDIDSHKENHNFNLRLDYEANPNTSIRIRPVVKLENSNSSASSLSNTNLQDGTALNSSVMSDYSTTNSADINNSFLLRHKLNQEGRTITLDWKVYYHQDNTNQDAFTNINYYESDNIENDSTAQRILGETEKFRTSANLIFTEKLTTNLQLKLNYFQSWEQQKSDRKTYDILGQNIDGGEFIEDLSNTFTSQQNIYRPEAGLLFKKDKLNITTAVKYQYSTLQNESIYPYEEVTSTNFGYLLPSVFINYAFSRSKRLRFSYQKNVTLPSVSNLQSVVDYSDPLNVSTGNPYLEGEENHVLRINFKNFNIARKELFFVNFTAQQTNNKITQYSFIAESDTTINGVPLKKGSSYTAPVNLDGYLTARGILVYSKPIQPIKTNISFMTTGGYTRNVGITNDLQSYTFDSSLGQGIKLASNISKNVDFNISGMATYHWINNDQNETLNGNYLHNKIRAKLTVEPIQRLQLSTSFTGNIYIGDDDLIQENIYKWNAAIAYKLFKKRQGEFRFSVSDILNQNSSINRTVTESYIQTSTYNVLPRYFMLSFIYRPKGKTNPKGERGERGGMRRGGMMPF
ncbi:outer membrane beta-barrel protein [Flammeovirga sp. SubArs3]|uniref:outer membrane beta-barrel protein n=1 Tax=Flammeovirga sp. SubArs3 TaxID=2995316 RepID=UPI00248CD30C|nr:outer membrane beta-barrel protein [Flammeovirga sp. SubArs3]